MLDLELPEKQEQAKPQTSKTDIKNKYIIAKINETETKKSYKPSNKEKLVL
jgi:hypothetical protein